MRFFSSYLVLSSLLVVYTLAEECKKQDKCECVGNDGWGFNLTSIDSLVAISNGNIKFFFHPCGNTKGPGDLPTNSSCYTNGYTLCMFDTASNITTLLGTNEDMTFRRETDSDEVVFTRGNKTSSVTLECAPKTKTSVLYAPPDVNKDQVNLSLYSKLACPVQIQKDPEPRGIFLTFLIIMLTLIFVYLFMGMLINFFFIGARGFELIPNYDFWCKVFKSARIFFIYVKNGCRVIPTEDSYDAI